MSQSAARDTVPFGLSSLGDFPNPYSIAALFLGLLLCQALGFVVLGTGRAGLSVSEVILVLHNLVALGCISLAFRRAGRVGRPFWFLFAAALSIWLAAQLIWSYDTILQETTLSDSGLRLLFRLYGAPLLMALFLPEFDQPERLRAEIYLDLFLVATVIGLSYFTLFYLPVQNVLPERALLRNISASNLLNVFLLVAVFGRLYFARAGETRAFMLRLWFFLVVYALVTFLGNRIDLTATPAQKAWFDLGWALPYIFAGLVAASWKPTPQSFPQPDSPHFLSFLRSNLMLVAVLVCIHTLTDGSTAGKRFMEIAMAAALVAFTLRLALTQYRQQQEIAERKAAQLKLGAANETIRGLLEESLAQTRAITQISEFGSLLQACSSPEEAYRVIPERLRKLFPEASGALSVLSASKNRAEAVAEWGQSPPADQIFGPGECWALRRGAIHAIPAGRSVLRCSHLMSDGNSICFPLIANGEALGVLALQDEEAPAEVPLTSEDAFARERQLVSDIAEHISLALANLNLREALRVQAVRDPLTGLYNRRHMQEFLEREVRRARRKQRQVALMMLDLDNFKRYNDTYGHSAGDRALSIVGEILQRSVRGEDLTCRYGGEEFVIIFTECSLEQATLRAEDIRNRFKEQRMGAGEARNTLTVSIGIAGFPETTENGDLLLKFADEALYRAKREGRDRVCVARPVL